MKFSRTANSDGSYAPETAIDLGCTNFRHRPTSALRSALQPAGWTSVVLQTAAVEAISTW